jgi:hypothetical protein
VPSGPRYRNLLGYLCNQRDAYEAFLVTVRRELRKVALSSEGTSFEVEFEAFDGNTVRMFSVDDNSHLQSNWRASAHCRIIKKYFRLAQKVRKSRRLVEKTPHHYLHVHKILWAFPNARVIWMIRHPVDTFASSLDRSNRDPVYRNYWDADGFIGEYDCSFRRLNYYERAFPGKILRVRYEDFTSGPREELRRVCAFLQEPYDPEALTIRPSEVPPGDSPDPLLFGKITARTKGRWAGLVTETDARRIECALTARMEEVGYSLGKVVDPSAV